MWTVSVRERDKDGKIRWYCLQWDGARPLSYLSDGRKMGSYRFKLDAQRRADELNANLWHVGQ